MASLGIQYNRNIKKFEKKVAQNKWQVSNLPSWWPQVKKKPVLISEGDSWFDYPLKSLTDVLGVFLNYAIGLQNFGMNKKTNVIDYVSRDDALDALTLRLERSGDHAQELIAKQPDKRYGVWEKKFPSQTLYTALQNPTIASNVDVILLSAGGNDMCSAVRRGVIQEFNGDCEQSYDKELLKLASQEVVQYYLQAILYRDQFAPQAKILCHSYAYAIQVYRGTTIEFDLKDIGWLVEALLKHLKLDWLKKPLKDIGINVDDLGEFTKQSEANLHESFDEFNWPANPSSEEKVGVDPDRAQFICDMIDSLYDEMQNLPLLYKSETGQELKGFEYLDVRNEVQDPKYWADFIHLNSDGYKKVGKLFTQKVQSMI